jgi:hypothetical protein
MGGCRDCGSVSVFPVGFRQHQNAVKVRGHDDKGIYPDTIVFLQVCPDSCDHVARGSKMYHTLVNAAKERKARFDAESDET